MLKRVATILNRLVGYLFMAPSLPTEGTASSTVNSSPVQSGQPCKDAQTPVAQKPKRKPSTAKAGTTAASRKQTQNPVLAVLGQGGLQRQIRASQPASKSAKRKPSVAQPTKQAQSPKQTQKPAQLTSGKDGLQPAIPVSKTRLPVKPAVKAKAVRVPSIKAALLSQQEQAPVLTPTEALSGERGQLKTRASKTRQVAKVAPTKKPKAVASTTQAKKRTVKQTPAQTRTARPSKVRGS